VGAHKAWLAEDPCDRRRRPVQPDGSAERTNDPLCLGGQAGDQDRPGSNERSREMAARYLPPEKVVDFLEYERTQLGEHVAVYMRPERWLSANLGPAW
jgi:hypothetical protein